MPTPQHTRMDNSRPSALFLSITTSGDECGNCECGNRCSAGLRVGVASVEPASSFSIKVKA